MTTPDVAGETLYYALTPRAQCHVTRTKRFDHLAAEAFARGWAVGRLADRITSGNLGFSPGGTITARLEECAQTGPARSTAFGRTMPFCSPECRENGGWLLETDFESPRYGYPTGHKCPCRTKTEATG